MKEQELYLKTGSAIKDAEESQMFGKPCFKVNGKAFMCFFEKCMVFKLTGKEHKEALALDGSQLFDPSKKGRAMKEWVQVPFDYSDKWKKYAKAAYDYVKG
ncbi:MAG: hypothetical protein K0S32_2518 [Bacteroidetes bacterium]|jgi:hypothetical protein|nr:hypothetical protein [Bacteroidota bacterium]